MSKFSQLAYSDEASARQQFVSWGFDSRCITVGTMVAHIAWNSDVAIIAFRGTDMYELEDWIVNLTFHWLTLRQGRIHKGWYDAFQSLEPGILAALPRDGKQPRKVWITGHSLGGALAVVCGYALREKGMDVEAIVTFGQPMVADPQMAAFLGNENRNRFIRFVNDQDIVTKIPVIRRVDFSQRSAG